MKLIIGLGNPGLKYKYTRHNIGARIIEQIAKENKIKFKRDIKIKARIASGKIRSQYVNLFKPLRFMNICGLSVASFMLERTADISDLLVVCDCLDLAFGKIRLKASGRDAGHRGIRSIITSLGKDDFSRLKIGIGRPLRKTDVSEYVLSRFEAEEEAQLAEIIKEAKLKIYEWINSSAASCREVKRRGY